MRIGLRESDSGGAVASAGTIRAGRADWSLAGPDTVADFDKSRPIGHRQAATCIVTLFSVGADSGASYCKEDVFTMDGAPLPASGVNAGPFSPPVLRGRNARDDGRPRRMTPLMRRVEVACLSPDGEITQSTRFLPAMRAFEEPFAAFTRATLVPTERGLTAVGDLWPGDRVRTVDGRFETLLWKGSTMLVPQAGRQDPAMGRLTRIAADALGVARPMHDLVLGPSARIVHRACAVGRLTGKDAALIPARDFVDGCGILEIMPPAPVEICHLGFAGHEIFTANGVEVESYHPGPLHELGLRADYLELLRSCLGHLDLSGEQEPTVWPRLRRRDLGAGRAA